MSKDDEIKILTQEKDKSIKELKREIDLLNGALYRANKKMIALQHEIIEFKKTGDIKTAKKEYEEIDK